MTPGLHNIGKIRDDTNKEKSRYDRTRDSKQRKEQV